MPTIRCVGMEIEFDHRQIEQEPLYSVFENEIRAKSNYPIRRGIEGPDQWTLKSDSSCGWEITSPAIPYTEMGIIEISRVIRAISHRLPSNICTNRCGIHVHVEGHSLSEEKFHKFFKMWYDLEPAIWSLHAPYRPTAYHINSLRNYGSGNSLIPRDHSDTVNLRGNHTTGYRYEFRYCQSTIDAEDIQFWLMTILYLTTLGEKASMLNIPWIINTEPEELQDFIWKYRSGVDWLDACRPNSVE